jgi:cobalt-zinc-cadmium efflux system outer membrane protein
MWISAAAASLLLTGCVLAPKGTRTEQAKLELASRPFESPAESRGLPELPTPADWGSVLQRGFLANGELESAYFDWKASMARIDQAAAWPNSNASVGFGYMFSPGKMKSWDRTTVSGGFPGMNLSLPIKPQTAGKIALEAARASGERFRAVKFELQHRILRAWLDLSLTEEKSRIQRDNVALLKSLASSAADRAQAGGTQQDLLKAQIEAQLAENELGTLEAEARSMRASLNGMLARDPDAPLVLPTVLPAPRPVTTDDARLILVAVDQNPELASLARLVAGRKDAIELARLAYIPDFNPSGGFTGSVAQFAGVMLVLPTNVPSIRGAINEAKAMWRSTEAVARQTRSDRAASFVASLYIMRNSERQVELFDKRISPAARQLLASSQQAYAAGAVGFVDLIDSERTLIAVRVMVAEARIQREQRLAELEALAGVDVETLGQPATAPAIEPATLPAK